MCSIVNVGRGERDNSLLQLGSENKLVPNILITNAYTWYNKGDIGIVIGMVTALRTAMPDANIAVLSFTPKVDEERLAELSVPFFSNPLNPYPYCDSISYKLRTPVALLSAASKFSLFCRMPRLAWPLMSTSEHQTARAYVNSDIVVSCGGAFLGGHNPGSLLHLYAIRMARFFGKKVVIYAQSISPTSHPAVLAATRSVLNDVDLLLLREPMSYEYVKSLDLKAPAELTTDAAFLVKPCPRSEGERILASEGLDTSQGPLVGMTVRDWSFPESSNRAMMKERYLASMAAAVEDLVQRRGATVILLPQVIFGLRDDDRRVSRALHARVNPRARERVKVLEGDYSPSQLKAIAGHLAMNVGTRMHSNIFSLSMGVPTLAIAYEPKTTGIMSMLGLDRYVLRIEALEAQDLCQRLDDLWNTRQEVRKILLDQIPRVEETALKSAFRVKDLLEEARTPACHYPSACS